ncbi:camphor resistance protein CrcB [Friedmanniella luteola]|uniref:Fluoride-specific ion channel FluC n=1 Tax=Friedmanniella luteola TaxID=546871 RepID=A0A1H1LP97_9ACTN|nr:CrcB family protein [Friedmanniella luteola]SDR76393.1 camphor resistance protein CrcB [Friedmanniella luteola]
MTPALLVVVALAGGAGAAARLVLDGEVRRRLGDGLPRGTALVNLSGSLLLGLLTGLAAGGLLPPTARVVVGTGFLGGFTTFSTAAVETVRLALQRRTGAAVLHGAGQLVAGVLLAGSGLAAGLALAG